MLIDARDATTFTEQQRFDALLSDKVGICPETRAYLTQSRGRRRAGRAARYTLFCFDSSDDHAYRVGRVTATNDTEAIQKANARLSKWQKTPKRFNRDSWSWEDA